MLPKAHISVTSELASHRGTGVPYAHGSGSELSWSTCLSLCHTLCLMRALQYVFKPGGQAFLSAFLYQNQLAEHFILPHKVLDELIKRLNHVPL